MKLLHFTADWCQPCKMMKPIIEEVTQENSELEYLMVDVDVHPEVARDYEIMGVPTFIILDENNAVIAQTSGAMTKEIFKQRLSI